MTQACHAATAILHITKNEDNTKEYLEDLDNMHKVVLEVKKTSRNSYLKSFILKTVQF